MSMGGVFSTGRRAEHFAQLRELDNRCGVDEDDLAHMRVDVRNEAVEDVEAAGARPGRLLTQLPPPAAGTVTKLTIEHLVLYVNADGTMALHNEAHTSAYSDDAFDEEQSV